jgi:hypothetical protein
MQAENERSLYLAIVKTPKAQLVDNSAHGALAMDACQAIKSNKPAKDTCSASQADMILRLVIGNKNVCFERPLFRNFPAG